MTARGTGTAHDATTHRTVGNRVKNAPSEAAVAELHAKLIREAEARVAAAQGKVDRQRAHLAGAEAALASAQAELEELG